MFLKGKGWIAQEFYNEYLALKTEISELTLKKSYLESRNQDVANLLIDLDKKVSRMKFVLQQLQLNKVNLDDLILLSIGVEIH